MKYSVCHFLNQYNPFRYQGPDILLRTLFWNLHSLCSSCVWVRDQILHAHKTTGKIIILFLVNDQRDAQIIFCVFISIYNSLHVSSTSCLSSGETNFINTASGNCHSMLVAEMCAGWKNLLPTCTHLGHQHRMTVTRGCIDTICLS